MMTDAKPVSTTPATRQHRPIFILSLPRTGSTLMRMILDTHPQICCSGELSLGQLCTDLHTALYFSIAQASAQSEAERADIVASRTREIIDGFMNSYAALKGKTFWAEKTPANIEHLDRLYAVFPQAAYICLHRDLLDMIRSGWESTRFGKLRYELWDYQSGIEFSLRHSRTLLDFERRHPAQTLRLHYEALVQNPARELARLFGFLGLGWDTSLLDAVFTTSHEAGPGDPKVTFATRVYTTSVGRGTDLTVLSEIAKTPKPLQNALSELQRELGYPDLEQAWHAANQQAKFEGIRATPGAAASGLGMARVEDLFGQHFRTRLDPRQGRVADLKGAVKFVVKGSGGGTWTINLDAQPPLIEAADQDADCTITIQADDLLKLATGQLNVGECYLQARLRVAGNEALAISLGRALFA